MNKFNLSDWALHHRSLIWYLMIVASVLGAFSYIRLGRTEDPDFTIKTMIVTAQWPGASMQDTLGQVTDRLEKKLEEIETLDYTKSTTTPGATTIYVVLKDTTGAAAVRAAWQRVRNILADIKGELPEGVEGPAFNDDFGNVYGNIYAFTADGLTPRQLRDYVENVRLRVLTVPATGKVNLVGVQDEAIYLELSTCKIAALGLDRQAVIKTLQAQNAIVPSGVIQAGPEQISLRVSGSFVSEDSLRAINLRVNDRYFRLSDVATIKRGYVDPPSPKFRFNGEPAIGLAIGMKAGANLLDFGQALKAEMTAIEADLPVGVGVHLVANQPETVQESVSHFVHALVEAVVIVLVVSFISLGLRAGLVVALAIPIVLAITFVGMELQGIALQRISLGALIIALGLLVDDAMIAVEMMVAKLEEGESLAEAATAVYRHTAFPMLTGTLVTIASFIPVGLNNSAAGEFTYTLFVVIAISLIVSWVVAVLFTPLLGVTILPRQMKHKANVKGRFARLFERLLRLSMRWRWITLGLTVATFAVALYGTKFVENQFFPPSDRPELVVDWNLPQNASILETKAQTDRFEQKLLGNPDIEQWPSYVGVGAIRFLLSFDVQPRNDFFGQMIIVAKSLEARDRVHRQLDELARNEFVGIDIWTHLLEMGPPTGRPVGYRISGPDQQTVRHLSRDLARIVGSDDRTKELIYDRNEPARVVRIEVLQDKARQLGVSSEDIADVLNSLVGGSVVTQVRDAIYLVGVRSRANASERGDIGTFENLQLPGQNGQSVPLAAVARFRYEMEQPVVWRRSRLPTVTVRANVIDGVQPATVNSGLAPQITAFASRLPRGYRVQVPARWRKVARARRRSSPWCR